jgi:hypothetical protein
LEFEFVSDFDTCPPQPWRRRIRISDLILLVPSCLGGYMRLRITQKLARFVRNFDQNSDSEICKCLQVLEINFLIFLKRASFFLRILHYVDKIGMVYFSVSPHPGVCPLKAEWGF